MLSLLRLEHQQKDFLKSTLNLHITLSFLFGIEMTNTFMHSLKNHTEQNGTKTIPFGAAFTYKGIYKGVSHPPTPCPGVFPFFNTFSSSNVQDIVLVIQKEVDHSLCPKQFQAEIVVFSKKM